MVIEVTEDTPQVIYEEDESLLSVKGPSFPENAIEFYTPIIERTENLEVNSKTMTCEFDFSILSSASNKMIYEIMMRLDNKYKEGKPIKVKWYYESFDEDMYDEGLGIQESLSIPFEIIEK